MVCLNAKFERILLKTFTQITGVQIFTYLDTKCAVFMQRMCCVQKPPSPSSYRKCAVIMLMNDVQNDERNLNNALRFLGGHCQCACQATPRGRLLQQAGQRKTINTHPGDTSNRTLNVCCQIVVLAQPTQSMLLNASSVLRYEYDPFKLFTQ